MVLQKFEKNLYKFLNTDDWAYVPPMATQLWSHGNKDEGASDTHLREYIRLLETLLKTFEIDVPEIKNDSTVNWKRETIDKEFYKVNNNWLLLIFRYSNYSSTHLFNIIYWC